MPRLHNMTVSKKLYNDLMKKDFEKIFDDLIHIGIKIKRSAITSLYGVYFIELNHTAYSKTDLELILSVLPNDALIGHYPALTTSLAINTRISIVGSE